MQKPNGWETSEAYTGDFESLPLGGHICVILDAKEETTRSGKPMLIISFDIAPNEPYAGYFKKQFQSRKQQHPNDAKWPNGGVYRQFETDKDGTCNKWFKGMITVIEKSNPGYKFNFDEHTLKGKLFGGVFGREEYEDQNYEKKWATKCVQIRSVEAIQSGVEIPKDKPLKGTDSDASTDHGDFTEISSDEDLPF